MYNAKEFYYGMLNEDERAKIKYLPTMCDLLTQGKEWYADSPAVNNYARELTYSALYEEVGKLRGFLNANGLKKGDKVGLFFRNDADFIKLFFAVTTAGGVVIPFPVQLPKEALMGSMMKFQVSMLFCADEFAPLCKEMPVKVFSASEITDCEFAPFAEIDKDDDCAIFFTGGTTGRPKGALLSHGAMMRGSYNGCFVPTDVIGQRYYALLPFSHIFGTVRNLLSCIHTGSVIYTCTDMKKMFADFQVAKPSIMVLVPALADMLLGVATLKGMGALGGNLKMIIAGGATVPPTLIKRWNDAGVKLLPGYGLTETANLVSGNGLIETVPESVGRPYEAEEVKIIDGEIRIKGENLFKCYYNDPEETAKAFDENGYFRTGDLGKFDDDNNLYIVGRSKNLIILANGENVSPEELELYFYRLPIVKDCLVKEYTNENGFAMIAVEILPNMPAMEKMGIADPVKALEDATEKINASLPSYMRISKVIVRDSDFKRTPAMKIVRE